MSDNSPPSKRISRQQVRILVAIWGAISVIVVLLVFLATGPSEEGQNQDPTEQSAPTSPPTTLESFPPQATDFGYGVQARADYGDVADIVQHVNQLGLNWIKQQIRWADFEPEPDQYNWMWLDDFVDQTDASNTRVMLSIVDAPLWSRTSQPPESTGPPDNPRDYVEFVLTLLQRYPGKIHAIEIWNEQNLQREWHTPEGLSAERYLELLRLTHDAAKTIDPNIIVVSGALAPTGVNDGVTAIDDFEYLTQMINAGLLETADCIGAHHTGINLPPNITAEEAFDSGAPAGTVFLGPYDTANSLNPHHSWSFRSTLQGQYNIIASAGGTQRLCVTEFGWPSMEGIGVNEAPTDFEFAYDNSLANQADYTVQAYQLLREWGIAQMAFLWNLDFAPKGNQNNLDDNMLYSILAPDGSSRPVYDAIVIMPKE